MFSFTYRLVGKLRTALVTGIINRNKGSVKDPVQQLFLDKIREYKNKSTGDKFVDPSPTILKELEKELAKVEKQYGGDPGVDMTAFPTFKFEEPKLNPIDEVVSEKGKRKKMKKKTESVEKPKLAKTTEWVIKKKSVKSTKMVMTKKTEPVKKEDPVQKKDTVEKTDSVKKTDAGKQTDPKK